MLLHDGGVFTDAKKEEKIKHPLNTLYVNRKMTLNPYPKRTRKSKSQGIRAIRPS